MSHSLHLGEWTTSASDAGGGAFASDLPSAVLAPSGGCDAGAQKALAAKERRRERYALQAALRAVAYPSQRRCRRVRWDEEVAVTGERGAKAFSSGLVTCKSAWSCPHCTVAGRAEAGELLGALCEASGDGCTAMVSLTVRHGMGHDLERLRRDLAKAWSQVKRDNRWKKFSRRFGLDAPGGEARAIDLTHSWSNGWHPHLHILFFATARITLSQRRRIQKWVGSRWRRVVRDVFGAEHVPSVKHGCLVTSGDAGTYIVTMGLELVLDTPKEAAHGHRTPWQIAKDYAAQDNGKERDRLGLLWRSYAGAMRGCKLLTWSRGLKELAELARELKAEATVEEETMTREELRLWNIDSEATIGGEEWDRIRDLTGVTADGQRWTARARLLEAAGEAELGTVQTTLDALVTELLDQRAREDCDGYQPRWAVHKAAPPRDERPRAVRPQHPSWVLQSTPLPPGWLRDCRPREAVRESDRLPGFDGNA